MKSAFYLSLITHYSLLITFCWGDEEALTAAQKMYVQGEEAKTLPQRKRAFNEALVLYMKASQQGSSDMLDFDIGNTFYQLEEYPWAILYYKKALEISPRDSSSKHNLMLAREKLGLHPAYEGPPFLRKILSFGGWIAFAERKELFVLLGIISFAAASGYIWLRWRRLYKTALVTGCAAGIFLLNIGMTQYGIPVEGVIVETTGLYSTAGWDAPLVIGEPIQGGSLLQIIDVTKQGNWLKVSTPDGHWGYVPYESIRLI